MDTTLDRFANAFKVRDGGGNLPSWSVKILLVYFKRGRNHKKNKIILLKDKKMMWQVKHDGIKSSNVEGVDAHPISECNSNIVHQLLCYLFCNPSLTIR